MWQKSIRLDKIIDLHKNVDKQQQQPISVNTNLQCTYISWHLVMEKSEKSVIMTKKKHTKHQEN